MPVIRRLRSAAVATAREALLHLQGLRREGSKPTVLVFPSQSADDGAANLRGYSVAAYLRTQGWNAFTCPKNLGLSQRQRVVSRLKPDVILMQMARHPLNRPSLYPKAPVVFDIDDADYVDPGAKPTVDEALRTCRAVTAGSKAVAAYCRQFIDDVTIVWTGSPVSSQPYSPQSERRPIIAWAATGLAACEPEAAFLVDVCRLLVGQGAEFELVLYSDDGSEKYRELVRRFEGVGAQVRTLPYMSYGDYLATLEEVAVGLAPLVDIDGFSSGKSFGKALAYMDRGVPIVTHPVVDHPDFFRDGESAFMAESAEEWAGHIGRLLKSPEERQRIADAAHADFVRRLSISESASRIGSVLGRVVAERGNVPAKRPLNSGDRAERPQR